MTIKKLKEMIAGLPDDVRVYADDGTELFGADNSEFLTVVYNTRKMMCVMETAHSFDVDEEVKAMLEYASENDFDEQDFWIDFCERGYLPEMLVDDERKAFIIQQLKEYGLYD